MEMSIKEMIIKDLLELEELEVYDSLLTEEVVISLRNGDFDEHLKDKCDLKIYEASAEIVKMHISKNN
jgi:hypothetical protein